MLTEQNENLTMKTLGLLRNLICNKLHIDQIMQVYGNKVIQAIVMILEGDYSVTVKEQALCVLSNIADGNASKEYIMGNEDLLRKINSFMVSSILPIQLTSRSINSVCSEDSQLRSAANSGSVLHLKLGMEHGGRSDRQTNKTERNGCSAYFAEATS